MAIIANLTRVDVEDKFDAIFDKYYSFLNNEYMVTVANVVGNSAMIALAKPHLIQRITAELLKVEDISLSPHLTAECKRVIAEEAVKTFDVFFQDVEDKEQVIAFVKRQLDSTRVTLREQAHGFLTRWG
jgi:2'-5' RNA ligase